MNLGKSISKENSITFLLCLFLAIVWIFIPRGSVFVLPLLATILVVKEKLFNLEPLKQKTFVVASSFLAFALLSGIWSIAPGFTLKGSLGGFGLLLAAFYLSWNLGKIDSKLEDRVILIIKLSFVLSIGLWLLDLMLSGDLFKIIQASSKRSKEKAMIDFVFKPTSFIMGALLFPVLGSFLLKDRKYLAILLFIMVVAGCYISKSSTALLGVIAGGAVFLVTRICSKLTYYSISASIIVAPVILPIFLKGSELKDYMEATGTRDSFFHRLIIWDFSITKWLEKPILGWGAGSARVIPGGEVDYFPGVRTMSLHPHNFILQTYLETGIVGMSILCGSLLFMIHVIHKTYKTNVAKAVSYATLASILVFASGEHSMWHHWWIGTMGMAYVFSSFISSKLDEIQAG